jgi:hypothetical protein
VGALDVLVGLTVVEIDEVHDYIQLVFSDGARLSVFNNYVSNGSLNLSQGRKIKFINKSQDEIVISFDGNGYLAIGMRAHDYNGPEAMTLHSPDNSVVVWN